MTDLDRAIEEYVQAEEELSNKKYEVIKQLGIPVEATSYVTIDWSKMRKQVNRSYKSKKEY